ncbi:NADP-reducing hydrogenase subunit HndD [Parabacteroides sp. PFB2-12]|nr:NADP-reducing hydrogenase subunit HndD [Parabacteroides sp. PM6-13]MDH6391325.1 NADP-reducing hydrogenase subunit HndD [Parabacteroides sp. PFB2-12]
METIKLTIDNKAVEVEKGATLLDAAKKIGIRIPTLCHLNLHEFEYKNEPGACRICVVEVEGRRNLAPACKTTCMEGMVVQTYSPRVINARKTVMELILSNHPSDCLICSKNENCELQKVAYDLHMRESRFSGHRISHRKDRSESIVRDMSKCIMCRRCETMCNSIQTVGTLSAVDRGFESLVQTPFDRNIADSSCTYCGQCVAVCPVGALSGRSHTQYVLDMLADPTKTVIVQTAPAVRTALGNDFGFLPGTLVTGKMVAALRQLGFDYVFDTDFAADLTIMEEGTELLGRLGGYLNGDKEVKIPLMTSCCPGWVNFVEKNYPELSDHLSTAKSPQQMFGAIAKTYFAEKLGIKREDLVVVSIMPCLAKKYEASRPEFAVDGNPDVDVSIYTRELARLIRYANIDFRNLPDSDFDQPLGESTGASVIFGTTGGVMEAACRTAYEVHTKKTLGDVNFECLRGLNGIKSATIDFDGVPVKVGIANGLGNARAMIEEVKNGTSPYHAIEIMACPGGCINGGGQPFHHGDINVIKRRASALYKEDADKARRKSHENPYIISLYKEYLGEPCGPLSHKLLHTHYYDRRPKLPNGKAQELKEICARFNNDPGELINVLHAAQGKFGYIPQEVQEVIAAELNIPVSKVYGVVSFYSFFTMTPKGKYPISICMGTACYVRGAEKVLDEFERQLDIKVGETTQDGLFSIDCLRCVGACGLAPVAMIGDQVYGRVTPEKVKDILSDYYEKEG